MPGTSLLTGKPIHLVVPWVSLRASLNLQRHRHLNDLLPSPVSASAHARGALPGDIQDVYKRPCPCVWQCLIHVLH